MKTKYIEVERFLAIRGMRGSCCTSCNRSSKVKIFSFTKFDAYTVVIVVVCNTEVLNLLNGDGLVHSYPYEGFFGSCLYFTVFVCLFICFIY